MQAKYRGKYKKCRTCKNAIEVMMVMVRVDENCPHGVQYTSSVMTDKYTCDKCEDWRCNHAS